MKNDDSNNDDGGLPGEDLSHWADFDEAAREALELYGCSNLEPSGNWIFLKMIESLACLNYPNPVENIRPYVVALRIMFTRCAEFGELDFEP